MAGVFFADTFYWIALTHRQDVWHSRVAAWANTHPIARLITTEEILSELLTWFAGSGPAGRASAASAVRRILANGSTTVLPQTSVEFGAALTLYEARLDKE